MKPRLGLVLGQVLSWKRIRPKGLPGQVTGRGSERCLRSKGYVGSFDSALGLGEGVPYFRDTMRPLGAMGLTQATYSQGLQKKSCTCTFGGGQSGRMHMPGVCRCQRVYFCAPQTYTAFATFESVSEWQSLKEGLSGAGWLLCGLRRGPSPPPWVPSANTSGSLSRSQDIGRQHPRAKTVHSTGFLEPHFQGGHHPYL